MGTPGRDGDYLNRNTSAFLVRGMQLFVKIGRFFIRS